MHYYYWRCYGWNTPCLVRCSEQEYRENADSFQIYYWHESWKHSGYYYWDKEADSHGNWEWKPNAKMVRPAPTYCLDTYYYGYFRSSKIDAAGEFTVRVQDLQECHLPSLVHVQETLDPRLPLRVRDQDSLQAFRSLALVAQSRQASNEEAYELLLKKIQKTGHTTKAAEEPADEEQVVRRSS